MRVLVTYPEVAAMALTEAERTMRHAIVVSGPTCITWGLTVDEVMSYPGICSKRGFAAWVDIKPGSVVQVL